MGTLSRSLIAASVASVALIGCATPPVKVSDDERRVRAEQLQALFDEQDPITEPLTMADAMARAFKYNVDHRVKLMEEVLARADLDVSRMDLLPRLVVDAGYSKRSNELASSSESIETGRQSLEPSRSSEREQTLANAELVWNLLDFGVSYVAAQQSADQVLIAEERRRKAVQNIAQDVRRAYWEALYAQRLGGDLNQLVIDIEAALDKSRQLRSEGLQSPSVSSRFQDSLLTTMRQLLRIRRDLDTSRTELAQLINVKPGTEFELAPTDDETMLPTVEETPTDLEQRALTDRPELREEDYQLRIDQAELKKVMLRMLPGIEIDLGGRYDSNEFLVNNEWSDAGLQISWNLFNLLSGPAFRDQARARVDLDNMRRLAISMAVLTQLHVAYENYRNANINFQISEELSTVSDQIRQQFDAQRRAEVGNDLATIRARARALVAQLQRDKAFASVQNAVGRIHNSIGLDPMPQEVAAHDLPTLSATIAAHQMGLNRVLEWGEPAPAEPQPMLVEPQQPVSEGEDAVIEDQQQMPQGKDAVLNEQQAPSGQNWVIEFHQPVAVSADQLLAPRPAADPPAEPGSL